MARRSARGLRYRVNELVDRSLIRGSLVTISILSIGAFVVVLLGTAVLGAWHVDLETPDRGILNTAWEVLLRALSPDQLAGNNKWSARIILLGITLIGLLLVSTLISVLNSLISHRVETIHRGRSPIALTKHVVVLNWNEFGPKVLREIVATDEAHRVSILTSESPIEIMGAIRDQFRLAMSASLPGSRASRLRHPERWITVRRGSTTSVDDLRRLAGIHHSSAVIVLEAPEEGSSFGPRVVLAVNEALNSSPEQEAALFDDDLPVVTFAFNSELAHRLDRRLVEIARTSPRNRRHINYIPISPEVIQHGIEVQVSRHRGLSAVYKDLVNFDGEEFYLVPGSTFNCTFGDLLLNSISSIPIALMNGPELIAWPEWSTDVSPYEVVMLATDRPSAHQLLRERPSTSLSPRPTQPRDDRSDPESFLFIGWTRASELLAEALSSILQPGCKLTVVLRSGEGFPLGATFCGHGIEALSRHTDDPLDDQDFLGQFDHVVVFSNDLLPVEEADAEVLVDLLACRLHADRISLPDQRFTIVAEVRREETRKIAGLRLADDLLVNDSLVASAAVQLALSPRLEPLFTALLSSANPVEIVTLNQNALGTIEGRTWGELVHSTAENTGEIPLGFRRETDGVPSVQLNPPRDLTMLSGDEIFVLSLRHPSSTVA